MTQTFVSNSIRILQIGLGHEFTRFQLEDFQLDMHTPATLDLNDFISTGTDFVRRELGGGGVHYEKRSRNIPGGG